MADKKSSKKSEEGFGISGFTLGIVSIIFSGWLGLLTAIVGFTFCMIQQKRHPINLGKAGIILNVIGFVVSVAFILLMLFAQPEILS